MPWNGTMSGKFKDAPVVTASKANGAVQHELLEFGPEMLIIAHHQGQAAGKTIDFQFDVDTEVMELISKWKGRDKDP
jgi:hypothetical protein